MKILVTGGAGFIGSHVVDAFLAAGHEVVDRSTTCRPARRENLNPQGALRPARHPRSPRGRGADRARAAARCSTTTRRRWTCAARSPIRSSTREVNLVGLLNLLEAGRAARAAARRLRLVRRRRLRRAASASRRAKDDPTRAGEPVRRRQAGQRALPALLRARCTAFATSRCATPTSTARARTRTARPAWWPSSPGSCCAARSRSSTATASRRATTCTSATWCAPTAGARQRLTAARSTSAPASRPT